MGDGEVAVGTDKIQVPPLKAFGSRDIFLTHNQGVQPKRGFPALNTTRLHEGLVGLPTG